MQVETKTYRNTVVLAFSFASLNIKGTSPSEAKWHMMKDV
jgi:hypothetical protein